jgi:hypothetical protein
MVANLKNKQIRWVCWFEGFHPLWGFKPLCQGCVGGYQIIIQTTFNKIRHTVLVCLIFNVVLSNYRYY